METVMMQSALNTNRNLVDRSAWYHGFLLTFLATGEETNGQFALVETVGRKGQSADPPWHIHTREEESFYVIEGELTFYIDDEVIHAPAGSSVTLPRGIPHRYELASENGRWLNLVTPAGFENFFKDLSEPAPEVTLPPAPEGSPDIPRMLTVAARYGIEIPQPKE